MLMPLTWDIPLGQPPIVEAIGRNAHGFEPRDRFRLDELWSLHLYGYDALVRLDGHEVEVHPGTLGITPPGTVLETRYYGLSVHLFAHFRLPPGATRCVAAVTDLGAEHQPIYDELYDAMDRFSRDPSWASARVWNALHKAVALSNEPSLAETPTRSIDLHPAVRRATDLIETGLSGRLSVAALARQVDVAPGYLTRLFQEAYGEPVVGYIRRRRMDRVSELLLKSTLPIKTIASSVGCYDLQQFNKIVRLHFGVGPREWRRSGGWSLLGDPTSASASARENGAEAEVGSPSKDQPSTKGTRSVPSPVIVPA